MLLRGGVALLCIVVFTEFSQTAGKEVIASSSNGNGSTSSLSLPSYLLIQQRQDDEKRHEKFHRVDAQLGREIDKYRKYLNEAYTKAEGYNEHLKQRLNGTLPKLKRGAAETTPSPEETDPTFYMLLDKSDHPITEEIVTVYKDEVFVTCFKQRKGDGKFSSITMFVNDKEIEEDDLITLMHSDAHEASIQLQFNGASEKEEDRKKTVKCLQSKDDEPPEEIVHTFVAPAPPGTVKVDVSTTEYRNMEMVKVSCSADGSPPPLVDIAYYKVDCEEADLPQPLMIVTAQECYVTPPACVQCIVQEDEMARSEGVEPVKSKFLVMRTGLGNSAPGQQFPGSKLWLFLGITSLIINLY